MGTRLTSKGHGRGWAAALLVSIAASAQAQTYAVVDLGTRPGGTDQYPFGAINNSGQVVGAYGTVGLFTGGYVHAFLYSHSTTIDLGTLGGPNYFSNATGINRDGQVVGWSCFGSCYSHAFLYSNGTMIDLGALISLGTPPGPYYSTAWGVNDSGQVVGEAGPFNDGSTHAFLYGNGAAADLGTLPGGSFSIAYAINDSGQIVGQAETASGYRHAFLYSTGPWSTWARCRVSSKALR